MVSSNQANFFNLFVDENVNIENLEQISYPEFIPYKLAEFNFDNLFKYIVGGYDRYFEIVLPKKQDNITKLPCLPNSLCL